MNSIIDKIPEIKDAIRAKLENATTLSEEIKSLIVGEREKVSKILPPMIWVYLPPATVDNTTMGMGEDWRWPIWIVSIIKDHNPDDGKRRAEQLALTASAAILKDNSGNPDTTLGGIVSSMKRTRWEPGYERVFSQDQTLFGSLVEIEIEFCTKEI